MSACAELCRRLASLPHEGRLGHDLEGTPATGITDFSFAWNGGADALWVPLRRRDMGWWWSDGERQEILAATRALLEDAAVPKVAYNALYEMFMWRWCEGVEMRGVAGDPMLGWHELEPELPRNINCPASLLSNQPYWGEHDDCRSEEDRARYNMIDSAMCLELEALIEPRLTPGQQAHYAFNLGLLPAMAAQMFLGLRYDGAARDALVASLEAEVLGLQGELDGLAGIAPPTFKEVAEIVCMKRLLPKVAVWEDLEEAAKPSWKEKA